MRALTVTPAMAHSIRLAEMPEAPSTDGAVLVEMLAIGICGTDREIIDGLYGTAPPGDNFLILGHESLGRVLEAPSGSNLTPGDLVVGIVRRPDPAPCPSCAAQEWDMCRNGRYTERGIKARHGFASERFRLEPAFAVPVEPELGELGVLLEPASIVAKAWEHAERIGRRAHFTPRRVLITGAGPIGLLACLMAAQRGLEIHVVDRDTEGSKPSLVRGLDGNFYGSLNELENLRDTFDLVFECTGAGQLVLDVICFAGPGSVVCLTGVSSGGRAISVDVGNLNRNMVLENEAVFGSVNANRRHYEQAARTLTQADPGWLSKLITRRVPLARWWEALERRPGDIKTILVP